MSNQASTATQNGIAERVVERVQSAKTAALISQKKAFRSLRHIELPSCPGTPDRFGRKVKDHTWSFHKVLAQQAKHESSRKSKGKDRPSLPSVSLRKHSPIPMPRDRFHSAPPDSPHFQETKSKRQTFFPADDPDFQIIEVADHLEEDLRSRCNSESSKDGKQKWTEKLSLRVAKLSISRGTSFHRSIRRQRSNTQTKKEVSEADQSTATNGEETRLSPLTPVKLNSGSKTVIVVGSPRCGKSSLIRRLKACRPTTEGNDTTFLSTDTTDVFFLEVNNKKDDLWLSLTASAYIILFAQDDTQSLDNAQSCLGLLTTRRMSSKKPIFLVANKSDAYGKIPDVVKTSAFSAKSCQANFVEASALLNENVENLSIILNAELKFADEGESPSKSPNSLKPPKSPLLFASLSVKKRHRLPSMDPEKMKKKHRDNSFKNCLPLRRGSRSCENIIMLFASKCSESLE